MTASRPLRAISLCNLALLLFACLDTSTKSLTGFFDPPLIVGVRYISNLALMLCFFSPARASEMVRTTRTGLVILRGCCLAVSSLLVAFALQRMPVAEATAIMFLAPAFIVLAAGPILKEQIGPWGWGAVMLGFCGVMLVVRPGSGLETIGVVLTLCAAILMATYQLMSRSLAASEKTFALLFYTAAIGSAVYACIMPFFLADRMPTLLEGSLLACLGVFGGLGHYLFTAAFRYAPASFLAPVTYLQLLWAGLLGWIVFDHRPDGITVLGMLIVAASGVMVALRSRRPAPVVPPASS